MSRRRNNTVKTALTFSAVLIAGAVFRKKIIELVSKIPMVGDFVKDMSDKEEVKG